MKYLATMLPLVCALMVASQEPGKSPPVITWQNLLRETHDLTTLAQLPVVPFSTGQFSSYDRASVSPDQREDWFANHDRAHCYYEGTVEQETPCYRLPPVAGARPTSLIPAGTKVGIARHRKPVPGYVWVYTSGTETRMMGYISAAAFTPHTLGPVLADITGPGCLTRFWSSNPGEAGKVRIYLDNQAKPVIEARLLDLLSGNWELQEGDKTLRPIPSPWACEKARGYEMLFPIPFQSRCLVVADRPNAQYQISYRRYASGTAIKSFDLSEVVSAQASTVQVQAQKLNTLSFPSPDQLASAMHGSKKADASTDVKQAVLEQPLLPAGSSRELVLLEGPGENPSRAVVQLEAVIQADRMMEALRRVVLAIHFDDADKPQVMVPLGDFFGTAAGANPLSTWPLQVTASGKLTSRWIMPYARNARLVLTNHDTQPVTVQLTATHVPYAWTDRSLHFHADWRMTSINSRPYQDWLLLKLEGKGHLAGTFLTVHNPVKAWWGEGDTKVSIDGENYPSLWGTGTDDDFGLGWADKTTFSLPWRAQPRHDGQGHEGFTSLFRARLLDRISFSKSLKYELEIRHDLPNVDVQYAATSYWYALPGTTIERMELTAKVLAASFPGGQP